MTVLCLGEYNMKKNRIIIRERKGTENRPFFYLNALQITL